MANKVSAFAKNGIAINTLIVIARLKKNKQIRLSNFTYYLDDQ